MDTTPPDREFCARGEQLYVEAQLDLACWRRGRSGTSRPPFRGPASAGRRFQFAAGPARGHRAGGAPHHEGVSSSRECVLCLEMTLNILTHIHVKP